MNTPAILPRRPLAALTLALALSLGVASEAKAFEFTRVPVLEPAVKFWQKVYAVWSVNDIAFHDRDDLSVVYRVVRVPARGKIVDGKNRSQAIAAAKAEIEAALDSLAKKRPTSSAGLSDVEKEVFENLKDVTRADKYARPRDLRAQNGLRERFIEGYRDAGEWEHEIRARLVRAGLPEDLVALAYVESLMNIRAESHAGAVGPWQFMRPTAKEYMHVNAVLDERHDPIIATDAAAKYINTALKNVGDWPVAITSYNYGRAGMKRLMQQVGSSDFGTILKHGNNKRFGFAARNYYASFLAVDGVMKNPERFFPGVNRKQKWSFDIVRLPFPVLYTQMVDAGLVTAADLQRLNPSLISSTRKGTEVMPRGLPLRVPKGAGDKVTSGLLAFSPGQRRVALNHVRKWHRVKKGQTLTKIARSYGVAVEVLASTNGLAPDDKVRNGMKLAVPSTDVGYTLFPGSEKIAIPTATPLTGDTRVALKPPPDDEPEAAVEAKAERSAKAEPRASKNEKAEVKLVRLEVVKLGAAELPTVDLVASGELELVGAVDVVGGKPVLPYLDEVTAGGGKAAASEEEAAEVPNS